MESHAVVQAKTKATIFPIELPPRGAIYTPLAELGKDAGVTRESPLRKLPALGRNCMLFWLLAFRFCSVTEPRFL